MGLSPGEAPPVPALQGLISEWRVSGLPFWTLASPEGPVLASAASLGSMWPSQRSLGSESPERRFAPEWAHGRDPSRKGLRLLRALGRRRSSGLRVPARTARPFCDTRAQAGSFFSPGFWCPPSIPELGQAPGKCAEKPTDFQPHADSFRSPSTSTKMEPLTFQRDLTAQGSAPFLQTSVSGSICLA